MKRRFSGSERVRLYLAADGHCQGCGAALTPGWHAGHVHPYARGGETATHNGQALCPACNLNKGARMVRERKLGIWPARVVLRDWQMKAAGAYYEHAGKDFLVVATPGAGKTIVGLYLGHAALEEGLAERLVIVVPTAHLKKQWQEAARKVGLHLAASWSNGVAAEASDFHGVVLTYQQVAQAPRLHRKHCADRPTYVVFDEIHHSGEFYSWGAGLQLAFEGAVRRLSMSGTPFRSDKTPIPFVHYENGASQAVPPFGYSYGYGNALRDDVCRSVFFPSIEGRVEWFRNGEIRSHTFDEAISERSSSDRLRAALDPRCEWINSTLKEANDQLQLIRKGEHTDAGGLVIAIDQNHARAIAARLQAVTGEAPVIAVYSEDEPSKRIDEFANGNSAWIVAVRMVSEGVDIPRLRVVVYATNIQTEMYFRQAVGRVVRMVPGLEEQAAYFYLPADPVLMEFAQAIKEERQHEIEDYLREIVAEQERAQLDLLELPPTASDFAAIAAVGFPGDVIYEEDRYTQREVLEAANIAKQAGIPSHIPAVYLAQFRRKLDEQRPPNSAPAACEPAPSPEPGIGLEARKKGISLKIAEKVHRVAAAHNVEIRFVYARLNAAQGLVKQNQATEVQLTERLQILDGWLKNGGED